MGEETSISKFSCYSDDIDNHSGSSYQEENCIINQSLENCNGSKVEVIYNCEKNSIQPITQNSNIVVGDFTSIKTKLNQNASEINKIIGEIDQTLNLIHDPNKCNEYH